MKRLRSESKSEASSIEEDVESSEEFSEEQEPTVKTDCRRSVRSSTKRLTKQSEEKKVLEKYGMPSDRSRRSKVEYKNVEEVSKVKRRKTDNFKLEAATKNKVVWDGFRRGINWSTGFSDTFWNAQKDANNQWECAAKTNKCNVLNPVASHKNLEIGHKNGFYSKMIDVDPRTVCDGQKHWEVRLVSDVIAANEDLTNLQPQCKKCNRHKNQKKKDEDSYGFQPRGLIKCPGEKKCAVKLIITDSGEVQKKPKKVEKKPKESDSEEESDDSDNDNL